jgi:hypothetical protein
MTTHCYHQPPPPNDDLRLEAVTTCVGFDDILDVTLAYNHPHVDSLTVVTSHDDRRTQSVCHKHGVTCVQSDLFSKNGRHFNKGAAINAGMARFQYHGWRLHLDADIILPDNFRRLLFNHTHLDKRSLYGCDRVDVIGVGDMHAARRHPQHGHGCFLSAGHPVSPRYVDTLHGYLPLGYFQLWHADCQKSYPYSLGTAAHDDCLYAALWPRSHRHHLSTVIVHHLCSRPPRLGENWDGRTSPRL